MDLLPWMIQDGETPSTISFPDTGMVSDRIRSTLGTERHDLYRPTPRRPVAACQAVGITALLDAIISVEQAGSFKTAPAGYGLVQTELGVKPARTLFSPVIPWESKAGL